MVGLVGDPALVDALARSMLLELALSPLAEHLSLVTLGIDPTDAKEMPRWRPATDAADVASTLRSAASFFATGLAAASAPTPTAARALGDEAWGPTVAVVAAETVTPEILEAANGPGVVVVVGDCPADGLVVHAADGEVAIPSIGLVCVAQQLSTEAADGLSCLLSESGTDPVPAEPDDELNLIIPSPVPPPPASGEAGPSVSDPKASKYWRWLDHEFANGQLCVRLTQGARELAEFHMESGDPAAACAVAAKVLRMASLDEGLTNVLIRAHAALGSPEEAQRVYRRHEADLDEVLGEGPDDSPVRSLRQPPGDTDTRSLPHNLAQPQDSAHAST